MMKPHIQKKKSQISASFPLLALHCLPRLHQLAEQTFKDKGLRTFKV